METNCGGMIWSFPKWVELKGALIRKLGKSIQTIFSKQWPNVNTQCKRMYTNRIHEQHLYTYRFQYTRGQKVHHDDVVTGTNICELKIQKIRERKCVLYNPNKTNNNECTRLENGLRKQPEARSFDVVLLTVESINQCYFSYKIALFRLVFLYFLFFYLLLLWFCWMWCICRPLNWSQCRATSNKMKYRIQGWT